MTAKDPFDLFVQQVQNRERNKKNQQKLAQSVIEEKIKRLVPIRRLLKRIQDTGLLVHHSDRYGDRNISKPAERFEVFEDDSSPSFYPGTSLYFDHPGNVEIAVPNEWDEAVHGVICIRCSTPHPDIDLLRGPFRTLEDANHALASFLARSAVSIDTHPSS